MANRNEWVADRRLYLDKDGKVVEEGDPTRATLLVGAGAPLAMDDAIRLGLVDDKGETVKAKAKPAENKARAAAPANKSRAAADDDVNAATPESRKAARKE
jgi:hypothetical protein